MEFFTDKAYLGINYVNNTDSDFFLSAVGYHDFRFIAPLKTARIQKMYTLHFILSGSGTINIYGKKFHVKQYDMFFIPPDESMCYYPDENNPWQYVWVELTGKTAEKYAAEVGFGSKNPVIHCKSPHSAYKAAYDVFSLLNAERTVGYYAALAMFYRLLDAAVPSKSEESGNLFEQVNAYLSAHYHNRSLKIEDICRDFNISHSYLCKIFKGKTSVKAMLTEIRINEAKKLLTESKLNIAQVGYSVGFSDNFHFMKVFKSHTGMTAAEYRRLHETDYDASRISAPDAVSAADESIFSAKMP